VKFQTLRGIEVASEEDAARTVAFVLELTAEVIPLVCALVFALMTAASEEDAVVTSDCTAREPLERPAPVRVRVPAVHTSAARVPNESSVLPLYDQTLAGNEVMEEATLAMEDPSCATIEEEAVAI
jgi:hypothetical protein